MGPLPKKRLTESPPFGVDLMGPIATKNSTSEDFKRYAVLLTCLVTRLVHMEIVPKKTTGHRKLSDELPQTTLCEIESVVNSTPLTAVGESSPYEVLRPMDFIYKDVRHGTMQLSPSNDGDDADNLLHPMLTSHKAANTALSETERLTKKFWNM
ncbi:hypothetical protein OESDEN_01937 [Oesophagostomum dentatum]|uniref:Uncharacterized protein n=1 Tax=Oesophagostomum dentatum TaxID=61180 RepID=A0A0B1TPQ4_OESDE|nr:hypothetical protein OESDEN_01937 [Oesophagostomum dentatum]